ncbi:glycine betaine ABC transporter substrate-binding protein [Marivita sp. S2033]|uniref:glycine betaine ABC transporter substrate-binding protein n=1 Tax=Marivita sp. S2033 TaxID=3373187 RepID=UPI0039825BBD
MLKRILSAAAVFVAAPTFAAADCGEVSITEMTFSSAIITTEIASFLMEQGYPPSLVYTVATTKFVEENPEIAELMSKISFGTDEMSTLLAWKGETNATTEETAVHWLVNNKSEWADWLSDEARARLSTLLE